MRLLDPEDRVPAQDVGADQILDRVEQGLVAHELIDPRPQQMTAGTLSAAERAAAAGLVGLELRPRLGRLACGQKIDRRDVAPVAVVVDLGVGQVLRHSVPLSACRGWSAWFVAETTTRVRTHL